ncbi:MAG: uroporphyrinogen-III synthase [Chitinophagales bacterium]|nr:uroporphyrinogen-III synthase [Chitinophagales bacterium]HAE14276.1 uroporphyrinogen-III synthase [Bacteroidota bacterium]MCB9018797.1 uroporphyrinogen-III synthase [Chitinophagales bacterium]MCB9020910.1 uroporphyrinogen-III synthase [Chitinophagales bacterium]MCB9031883.1 uroporphyrinogen-III synthase [Chitinophagales bacterium]
MAQQSADLKPVKTILVSQPQPENPKNPYADIEAKFKVKIDFRKFISVEGVPAKEFRKQRIDINEHTAIILTSRNAIDHFFRICEELRIRMPESTKYFCQSEAIAVYLQKYIQFRKRKVFYGPNGKDKELTDLLAKHISKEKFLLPCATLHQDAISAFLEEKKANFSEAIMYEARFADLSDMKGSIMHDMIILFTPKGVESLFQNFPEFKQGDTRICGMGAGTQKSMEDHGLRVDIKAPTPESPSIFMAIENYLEQSNRRKKK